MAESDASGAPLPESLHAALPGGDSLHLARFAGDPAGPPVLMLHGAIESGRIFYSRSGKGLAPFLAARGFDVYVADFRGRGPGARPVGRGSTSGQTEMITEEIPALADAVREIRGGAPQHWVSHSWGGVLANSFLARFPERIPSVASLVSFGSKRTVSVRTLESLVKVSLVWGLLCPLAIAVEGYLPAKRLRLGSEDETAAYFRQCAKWVNRGPWVDEDGFDYGAAAARLRLPPSLYFAGAGDRALGHPSDVRDFMESSGPHEAELRVLSRANGNLHDYGHIDMLTHPDAARDHFPAVEAWLRSRSRPA